MREYTVQYMEGQDWIRITAIYDTWDNVLDHATDLLADGKVVRILARENGRVWHTVRTNSVRAVVLDNPVYGCPA